MKSPVFTSEELNYRNVYGSDARSATPLGGRAQGLALVSATFW